jgi:hypothetical protein
VGTEVEAVTDSCDTARDPVTLAVAAEMCAAHTELNEGHTTEIWEQEQTGMRVARCVGWVKIEATRDDRAFLIAMHPDVPEARQPHPPMFEQCRWHLHLLNRDEDDS